MEIASDVFKESEGIDSGKGNLVQANMLSSVFKAKNLPVNSEKRFNSNFVPVLFLSLFLFQDSYYVCSTNGVSFFHTKVVRDYKSDRFSISWFRLVPR